MACRRLLAIFCAARVSYLGTLTAHFATNHHFHTLGTSLHNEANDACTEKARQKIWKRQRRRGGRTIASATHGQTAQQLVLQRLGLSHSAQTAVVDAGNEKKNVGWALLVRVVGSPFGVKLNRAWWKAKALLNNRRQLANALSWCGVSDFFFLWAVLGGYLSRPKRFWCGWHEWWFQCAQEWVEYQHH